MSRYYSKRHYQLVSPPSDKPGAIEERMRNAEAGRLGYADMLEKFGELTAENAGEAIKYQEERIKFHYANLGLTV